MGYIREPKNVDLVVAPSVFTEDSKKRILQAIAQYKKTGKKPDSVKAVAQDSKVTVTHSGRLKSKSTTSETGIIRGAKI